MLTVSTNLNTLANGQYSNFDFNSFCEFGGKVLAAGGNGIFELNAAERDTVSATETTAVPMQIKIGPTDFGIKTDKRLRKCVLALEATGAVKLTVTCDEDSGGAVEVNQIPGTVDSREQVISLPFGRDLRGRYFTFLLENINGAFCSVNYIEAFIEILLQKPKKEGAI